MVFIVKTKSVKGTLSDDVVLSITGFKAWCLMEFKDGSECENKQTNGMKWGGLLSTQNKNTTKIQK